MAFGKHNGGYVPSQANVSDKLMLYKTPVCVFASEDLKAKELKLAFNSMVVTRDTSAKNVYVGTFDCGEDSKRCWLKPQIIFPSTDRKSAGIFVPPAWFIEITTQKSHANVEVHWKEVSGVMIPFAQNAAAIKRGSRLYRLSMPNGTCPPDVEAHMKKEEKAAQKRKAEDEGKSNSKRSEG